MTYVDVTVRVDTHDAGFTTTPGAARALVENILRRDPRFSTLSMQVLLRDVTSANGDITYDDVRAWRETAPPETAGDELHNLFSDAQQEIPEGNASRKKPNF